MSWRARRSGRGQLQKISRGKFFLRKTLKNRQEATESILTEFPERKKIEDKLLEKMTIIFQN